ncbi:RNA polymerase sigma-54 factor [Acidovorax sp. SRB_14]|uniref:RNA polymerase factor sigma-54 n=1 Tax=unclassified Acidovorax TaxID=2684926 RepID=UPI00145DE90F|nr:MULTISPECIES: RNA polymerase factor sigma-54 [unclassified Acidovorax]NMM77738.1 RNA polymerase sigma-54 factor [Acidovorax sp. SRB_24]NMM80658.1 RNA polymerase sigma-54 factor [Acidovorax sp. SRB_14]
MPVLALQFQHAQQHTMSPRLQRAVALLQMSTAEFNQAISSTLADNPFLEAEEHGAPPPAPSTAGAASAADAAAAEAALGAGGPTDADPGSADARGPSESPGDTADEAWAGAPDTAPWEAATLSDAGGERQSAAPFDPMDAVAMGTTLHEHLQAQLRLMRLPDRSFVLACLVAQELQDDGYLRCDLRELAATADLAPCATAEELETALACVQSLEPAGVGARDLAECLALQLGAVPCARARALCARLLEHVHRTGTLGDARQVARTLRCTAEAAHDALQGLRRLDPHPGWQVGGPPTRYITPDVIVRRTRSGWTAMLNDAVVPKVHVNTTYATLLQKSPRGACSELTAQLNEARWTVRHVAQRFSTILQVAQSILRRQQPFFDHGPMAMRPLGLREVADELGVHISTVSRVTHQKYMATPSGTFELKHFFSRALSSETGAGYSPTAIRGLVQEMIASESALQRLSDVAIAQQLQRQGIDVARRTVTKYRQQLGLPPAEQRAAGPPH